ncbi:hypothetical protein DSM25559_0767 [Agrobacterium rosae]|uniref:Uncharacterized protein n=1 Tax=Agrobacterium rosae TaxID=1972867 RepID=A0A1R3TBE9_9HYPH|nr:hypothetical protein DSM25559_0767 [Agrobacterium rosae]
MRVIMPVQYLTDSPERRKGDVIGQNSVDVRGRKVCIADKDSGEVFGFDERGKPTCLSLRIVGPPAILNMHGRAYDRARHVDFTRSPHHALELGSYG